jgi:hypothetical protein
MELDEHMAVRIQRDFLKLSDAYFDLAITASGIYMLLNDELLSKKT